MEALTFDIDAIAQGAQGVLRFGIGPAVASLFLKDTLAEICTEHRDLVPRFEVAFWTSCEGKLINREIDMFIGGFASPPNDDRFEFTPLYNDTIVALAHKDHPILLRSAITLEDLIHYPVLGFPSAIDTWRSLTSVESLELFQRNVPGSVMPDPLQLLPVISKTNQIVVVPDLNWRAVKKEHPDIVELKVERLRGMAHMYFVHLAGAELPDCYAQLVAAFKNQLAVIRRSET
ncbi:putative lysR substrate binding domain protein [Luminiphilus syltensis NOR5-1B]|uniref:Putative lysR substrate binding domain protein n=1 Tax=Luminiphilus syltensis NOR5-1B TaxID=565045 RepID=B8KXN8_9GAMM|nr:putative lysR substrate binding domain protein [Luminiphilus syltensis NOR5-1B]